MPRFLADLDKNKILAESLGDLPWIDLGALRVRIVLYHQYTAQPKQGYGFHAHPFTEFTLVRSGKIRYRTKTTLLPRKAGETFFMPAGVIHAWEAIEGPVVLDGYMLEFFPATEATQDWNAGLPALAKAWNYRADFGAKDAALFPEIDREIQAAPPYASGRIRLLVVDLIYKLFRKHFAESIPNTAPGRAVNREEKLFLAAKNFIEDHFRENPSLGAVAAQIGVTPRYVNRIFQNVLGVSCRHFIGERKLTEAYRELTLSPLRKVGEVARLCGFSDPLYFTKVFTARFGASPKSFRDKVFM